jgi:leucyl/phenylalanyl-tRNA--protein transferase
MLLMQPRPTVDGGPFGPPRHWRPTDLIALSNEFDADLVEMAYRHGVFPMPTGRAMGWFSPLERGILPLDRLRVTRSLRKSARHYEVRVDHAFAEVLAACGDRSRPNGWIDDDIRRVYTELHEAGVVHSVEAWTRDGELAGGLYGVSIGGLFAGESMFHRPQIGRDASKVALISLVERLASDGADRLLDVQWLTPHLASLGAIEVSRHDYLARLERALARPSIVW